MAEDRSPRQPVQLTATATLASGAAVEFAVIDLSYDGCKVRTPVALDVGTALTLSIMGLREDLDAIVRWCDAGKAGLQFSHKVEAKPQPHHPPRSQERVQLAGSVKVRRPGRDSYALRMFDLTSTGCRVEFVERPKSGELVWAKFEGMEAIEAIVRWVDGFYGGLEFVRPIHKSVFDLLLQRLRL